VLPASFKRSRRALVLASAARFKVRAHAARKLQLHRFPHCSLTSHGPARRGVVLTSSPSIKHQADHQGSAGDVASAVQTKAVEYIAPSSPPGAIAPSGRTKSWSPPDPSQLEQYTSAPRSQVLAPLTRGAGTRDVPAIRGSETERARTPRVPVLTAGVGWATYNSSQPAGLNSLTWRAQTASITTARIAALQQIADQRGSCWLNTIG